MANGWETSNEIKLAGARQRLSWLEQELAGMALHNRWIRDGMIRGIPYERSDFAAIKSRIRRAKSRVHKLSLM